MATYTNTSGRRKCAVARVYLSEGTGNVTINGKDYKDYFPTLVLQYKVLQAFKLTENEGKYDVKANLDGGGITGQAEALRLGISKALETGFESRRFDHSRPTYGGA
jgi:small subunit ribosomal protein S9